MNTTSRKRILIADDEAAQRHLLRNALEHAGYDCLEAPNGARALAAAGDCDLLLLDVRMPGMSGLETLEALRGTRPDLPVILLTAYIDVRDAVTAIKQGAADYLEKPVDLDELISVIDDTFGVASRAPDPELPLDVGIVAESASMREAFRQALHAARADASVLLLGESGTGKEVIAAYVHRHGPRAQAPFVTVDCTSLPESLAESILFGHVRGAFTGAERDQPGRFDEAEAGTVFLDEVGELPLAIQPKLLRVLESGEFRPVGAGKPRRASVRVIAATNRALDMEVARGRFREDLYFRLNVFPITAPPLRERPEDVLPLAELFLRARKKRLSPAAERKLLAYPWPGNVRELRNVLERAAILAAGGAILPEDLPPMLASGPDSEGGRVLVGDMAEIQRRAILEALERTGGNKTQAAALLGISRRNLLYKLRAYGQ